MRRHLQLNRASTHGNELSGLGYLRPIERWRAQGYRVSLYVLSLPNTQTAMARVAKRKLVRIPAEQLRQSKRPA